MKFLKKIDPRSLVELMRSPTLDMQVGQGTELQHGPGIQQIVRRLKKTDVYNGWTIDLDRQAVGLPLTAFILVKLARQDRTTLQNFSHTVKKSDRVIRVSFLSGSYDAMIEIVASEMAELDVFRQEFLNDTGLVHNTNTLISIDEKF